MEPARLDLALTATVASLDAGQRALAGFLEAAGVGPRLAGRAALLVEEVVLNVIKHGYGAPGEQPVRLAAELAAESLTLVVEDAAPVFDPTARALPARPARLEEAPVGGLGIVLLQRTARSVRHEALPGPGNRLTIVLDREAGDRPG